MKFLAIISLFLNLKGFAMAKPANIPSSVVISDFNQKSEIANWQAFTDEVMTNGVASDVKLKLDGNNATFTGELNLGQVPGNGFATIRRRGQWDFEDYDRVMFELESDGREYLFIAKDPTASDLGTSLQAPIKINADNIGIVKIDDLKEYFRGRSLRFNRKVNLKEIEEVGIMIKDGQAGPFELRMESFWIER